MAAFPALQARSAHEAEPGSCGILTLLDHPADHPTAADAAAVVSRRDTLEPWADWRHNWRELSTHHVAWKTVTLASPAGGDEELATTIWSALEGESLAAAGPLQIIRCQIERGTSVARRVRVAEISA